jgi:eukaryotic-like serine/threonine-protein kinase
MAAPSVYTASPGGRYVLHGEIASGGMATVYFGRLLGAAGFSRSVAIKRLHPQFAKDPDFVAMFVDEARLAARIAHPNVVPTLDVVSYADELLLVMEYVHGASLSRLLRTMIHRGEHMPPRIVASILCGVLRGLHAAHEAKNENGQPLGIVHRDVSPQNVLVGIDGIARVLDFGVAKASGRWQSTREGQLKGKIAYMAPEQIATDHVSRRTDLYAVAVLLWEALTNKRLFRADNEGQLLAKVLAGRVEPPTRIVASSPRGFDPIVLRGVDRDPDKRFANAREMAAALEAVVGTAPPTEVGEWVERVAADELRERTERIEEMERRIPSAGQAAATARSAPTPSAPEPMGAPEPRSQALHLAMARTHSPFKTARWRSIGIVMAVMGICALGAAHGWRAAQTKTVAAVMPGEPSHVVDTRSQIVVAQGPTAWTPILAASTPASPPTQIPGSTPNVSQTHTRPRASKPATKTAPDCTPPYTSDSHGHIHFKLACVN